jgi:L-alanine-DL-glutamate epimerase-like enolase superfamily enzyme
MKITRISTAVIQANFDWTIVKVETDEKITGYGEAFVGPGLSAVIAEFGRILVGEDPTSIDRLMRRVRWSCAHASAGVAAHAYCGIETAVLDVLGKKYGMPVWQILGGKYRDKVRIYADCHAGEALESIDCLLVPRTPQWMGGDERQAKTSLKHHGWDPTTEDIGHASPSAYADRAKQMAGLGFRILKFDVDVPTKYETDEYNRELSRAEIEHAVELVDALRKAVGPGIGLAVDCHWSYSVEAGVQLARALERFNLLWIEDPVPPENIRAIGEVQKQTAATIATGENHYTRVHFERLIVEAGLRLLAPDVQKIGLWEGRKIADLADMHYVNLTLHNISSPIGTIAGVHLCAAIPNVLALEWHAASVPFFDELLQNDGNPLIEDGHIAVPGLPGLGVTFNEEVAWRYRDPGLPFFGE